MFRFWTSDSRGSEKTVEPHHHHRPELAVPSPPADDDDFVATARLAKRRRSSAADLSALSPPSDPASPVKRAKIGHDDALSPGAAAFAPTHASLTGPPPAETALEHAKEAIQYQFGLEILLKHDELRLIDQELAKCQIALEQLRRCHLIPYPVACPTPQQMLDISAGKGAALQSRPGQSVPRWAPPFGVVDGPYARHYAKWLIPDPMFDGVQPEWQAVPAAQRPRAALETRSSRNAFADVGDFGKHRPVRGMAGQKLHALSSGYPQPKDKKLPCVLKRSDGQTVKLVCIDCNREDFSSTQGFINHCRIAHRRDFKSHEEAAVHCGHPIEAEDAGAQPGGEKPSAGAAAGLVHPYARNERITEQEAYAALRSRIEASLALYHAGKLPNVKSIPSSDRNKSSAATTKPFAKSSDAPYLSQLLQKKRFVGDLSAHIADAKTKMDLDEVFSPGDESDEGDQLTPTSLGHAAQARTPGVMRVPARTAVAPPPPPPTASASSFASNTTRSAHSSFDTPMPSAATVSDKVDEDSTVFDEEDMDVDLSSNTMTSNNAPSLVSDDGEYDDSDDGSSSETGHSLAESVSDVAEITIDDDVPEHDTPRPLHHRRVSPGAPVKLKKDDNKQVTFVGPVSGPNTTAKGRRKQKV